MVANQKGSLTRNRKGALEPESTVEPGEEPSRGNPGALKSPVPMEAFHPARKRQGREKEDEPGAPGQNPGTPVRPPGRLDEVVENGLEDASIQRRSHCTVGVRVRACPAANVTVVSRERLPEVIRTE
jgi:hypothetical protein